MPNWSFCKWWWLPVLQERTVNELIQKKNASGLTKASHQSLSKLSLALGQSTENRWSFCGFRSHHIPSIPYWLPFSHSPVTWQTCKWSCQYRPHPTSPAPNPANKSCPFAEMGAVTQAGCHTTYCLSSVTLEIVLTSQLRDRRKNIREKVWDLCLAVCSWRL